MMYLHSYRRNYNAFTLSQKNCSAFTLLENKFYCIYFVGEQIMMYLIC
jgi:hypothetical protein